MNPPVDQSLAALTILLSLGLSIAMYVWTALALAAMFRKMGEEPWKGWVPFLNIATVLKWGGFSPWLVVLSVIPVVNIAVFVLVVISAHRINPGFGYGSGMTVLAALLFVVWASILGFGPARWLGARAASQRPAARPVAPPQPPPPVARVISPAGPGHPPLPTVSAAAEAERVAASARASVPAPEVPAPASFAPPESSVGAWTPREVDPAEGSDVDQPYGPRRSAAPAFPAVPEADEAPQVAPVEHRVPGFDVNADAAWPSEIDDVSAIYPSPFPPSAAVGRPYSSPPVSSDSGPIAFVPGRRTGSPIPPPETPLVESVPVAGTPVPEPDVFPEFTGEVSAIVGSPTAGAPRSAAGAVSAQHRRIEDGDAPHTVAPPAPVDADDDDDDALDQTIITRRAPHATWELVPASGSPVPLTADVVVLGRRPSADASFPSAQLVAVLDEARTVSKTHARLELRGDGWIVTDLGSTNGVMVRTLMGDEVEVEPGTQLDAGERFFLGDEEFHLRRTER